MEKPRTRNGPEATDCSHGELGSQSHDRDELQRLGKKQVLKVSFRVLRWSTTRSLLAVKLTWLPFKRNFGFLSILGFSCTVLITWEGSLILFLNGLSNGGSAGLIYGYLLIWAGNFAVFASLSELVSMAPTSGGQYHWVAMLAPPSVSKFLSYMTGWLTVAGWLSAVASTCFLTSGLIQGLITMTNPAYSRENWHATLLFWAVLLFCIFINVVVSGLLPNFEGLILILHIVGFFAVLIPLAKLGPTGSAKEVFTAFNNEGNFSSMGLSFFVGLTGNAFAFLGETIIPRPVL